MTYEEAVEMMKNTLWDVMREARESVQDTVEDIVIEYYGWDVSKWQNTTEEEQHWLEEQELAIEELLWSDVAVAALIRVAADMARDRPPQIDFGVRIG